MPLHHRPHARIPQRARRAGVSKLQTLAPRTDELSDPACDRHSMYGTGEWLKSQPYRPGTCPTHSVPHHASRLPGGSGDATRATPWPFLNNGHSGMRTASARTLKRQTRPQSDRAGSAPGVAGSSLRSWRSARTACTPTGHAHARK